MKKVTLLLLVLTFESFAIVNRSPAKTVESPIQIKEPELADFAPEIISAQLDRMREDSRRSKYWSDEVLEEIKNKYPEE